MKKFLVLYFATMSAKEQTMKVTPSRRRPAWTHARAPNRNPRLFRLSSDDQA